MKCYIEIRLVNWKTGNIESTWDIIRENVPVPYSKGASNSNLSEKLSGSNGKIEFCFCNNKEACRKIIGDMSINYPLLFNLKFSEK